MTRDALWRRIFCGFLLAFGPVVFASAPARAEEPAAEAASFKTELESLKKRLDKLEGGGTSVKVGDRTIKLPQSVQIGADFMFLYQYQERGWSSTNVVTPAKSEFQANRLRLAIKGNLMTDVKYLFQIDAAKGNYLSTLDAVVNFTRFSYATLNVGQWDINDFGMGIPKYWQWIGAYNHGSTLSYGERDRGVGLEGKFWGGKLNYNAELLNGNGITSANTGGDENTGKRYQAMVRIEPFGMLGVKNSDLERGPFKVQLGLAAANSFDVDSTIGNMSKTWLTAGLMMKWRGLYAKGIYSQMDVSSNRGATKAQNYWFGGLGYAIPVWRGHMLEPIAAFEIRDQDRPQLSQEERWGRLGFNYYFLEYSSMIRANAIIKTEQGRNRTNNNLYQVAYQFLF